MSAVFYFIILFVAKVFDNMLGTAKTIFVQRSRSVFAGIALALSNFIYFCITKDIVMSNSNISIIIVSIASGVGCWIAVKISDKFSKDKTYVNVIMSDDMDAMQQFRDFLAEHHITNTAADTYTLDWSKKTITITAYPETKDESRLIDNYIENSELKFKRVIYNK